MHKILLKDTVFNKKSLSYAIAKTENWTNEAMSIHQYLPRMLLDLARTVNGPFTEPRKGRNGDITRNVRLNRDYCVKSSCSSAFVAATAVHANSGHNHNLLTLFSPVVRMSRTPFLLDLALGWKRYLQQPCKCRQSHSVTDAPAAPAWSASKMAQCKTEINSRNEIFSQNVRMIKVFHICQCNVPNTYTIDRLISSDPLQ